MLWLLGLLLTLGVAVELKIGIIDSDSRLQSEFETAIDFAILDLNAANDTASLTFSTREAWIARTPDSRQYAKQINVQGFPVVEDPDVLAVVGAYLGQMTMDIHYLPNIYSIPHCGYSAGSAILSQSILYRLFMRTNPSTNLNSLALAAFIKAMDWAVVATLSGVGLGTETSYFVQVAAQSRIQVVTQQRLLNTSVNETTAKLQNLQRAGATVFVLLCSESEVRIIMEAAAQLGMTQRNTWLFAGNIDLDPANPLPQSMQGLIATRWSIPRELTDALTSRIRPTGALSNRELSLWTPFLMDTVTSVGLAARSLQRMGNSPFNGEALFEELLKLNFSGQTGTVSFDGNAERIMNVTIINVQAVTADPWQGTTTVVGTWAPLPRPEKHSDLLFSNDPMSNGTIEVNSQAIMWPDGTNIKPWGTPSILHVVGLLDKTDPLMNTLQLAMQVATNNVNENPDVLPHTRLEFSPLIYDGTSGLVPAAVQATLDPLCVCVLGPHGSAAEVEKAHGPLEGARIPHFDFSTSTAFPQAAPPFFIRETTGDLMFAQAASDFIVRLQVTRIGIILGVEGQGSRLQLIQKLIPQNTTVVSVTLLEASQNATDFSDVTRNWERFGIRAVIAWIEDPEIFQLFYRSASKAGVGAADNVTWVVPGASRLLDYINNGVGDDARFAPDGTPVPRFTPLEIMELVGSFLIAPQLSWEWTGSTVAKVMPQIRSLIKDAPFQVINETALGSDFFNSPLADTASLLAQDAVFQTALHIAALEKQRKDPLNGEHFVDFLKGTNYYYVSSNDKVIYRIGRSKPVTVDGMIRLHELKTDDTLQRVLSQDIFNVGSEGRVVKAGFWTPSRQLTLDGGDTAYAGGLSSPPPNVPCNLDWGFDPAAQPQNQCSPCPINSTFDVKNWKCGPERLPPSKAYLRAWTIGGWLLVIVTIVVFILGFCYGLYDNGFFESSQDLEKQSCTEFFCSSCFKCLRCVERFFCCAVFVVAAKMCCTCLLGPLARCHKSRKSFHNKVVYMLQSAVILDFIVSVITLLVDIVNIVMNWVVGIISWVPVVEVNIWTIIAYFLCLLFATILFVNYFLMRVRLIRILWKTMNVTFERMPRSVSGVFSPRSAKNLFAFSPRHANSTPPRVLLNSSTGSPFSPKTSANMFTDPKNAMLRAGEGLASAKRWTRLHEMTIYLAFFENLVCLGFASLYFQVRGVGWNSRADSQEMTFPDNLMSVATVINLLQFGHRCAAFDWQIILHETQAAYAWVTESPYSFFPLNNKKGSARTSVMSPMPSVPEAPATLTRSVSEAPVLQLPPDRLREHKQPVPDGEEEDEVEPRANLLGNFLAARRKPGVSGSEIQLQRLPPALV